MRSTVAVTFEIDDLDLAAAELIGGIDPSLMQAEQVCGIVFCYSDMDQAELLERLRSRFPYPLLGCSCIANMDEREGFHELAATLTVLSADDCRFATAVSGPITPENVRQEVGDTYAAAAAGETPGLVIAFPPYNLNIMLDAFTNAFNEVAPGVPVLGGLPSYSGRDDRNMTYHDGTAAEDRLVLLAITGNIRPVFSLQNVSGSPVERKRKVTRAKDNVVYTVGNQTFVEYLQELGLPLNAMTEGNATITFVSNPLLLENVKIDGESSYSFVRTLHKIDPADGSGTAIGGIPVDATLSICTLQTEHIQSVARAGMNELARRMEDNRGYVYSTVLAISCIGRYLLLVPDNGAEVANLLRELPAGVSLSGFYSYGEISPITGAGGKLVNFAHNESLVLCAF